MKLSHFLLLNWGWSILFIAFGLGCLSIYRGSFSDEGDNFTIGLLIAGGKALYRDVFSHHFPFPYYYAAIVTKVFGTSIFFLRLSVWVFQVLAVAVSIGLTGYHKSLGLALLIWSIIRPFYLGNMFLYDAFCAGGMVVVFALTLAILLGHRQPDWKYFAVFGLFGSVSILSDPLLIYALGVAILLILVKNIRFGILAACFTGVYLAVYASYLFATGSTHAFFQDAYLFNSQVYGKYRYTATLRFKDLWLLSVRGLGISEPSWWILDPMKPIGYAFMQFDTWLFTGFIYRLSCIIAAIYLFLQKKYHSSVFVYVFAAALLLVYKGYFHAQPFVLVALIVIVGIITQEWWSQALSLPLRYTYIVTAVLFAATILWVSVRSIAYSVENWREVLPSTSFVNITNDAKRIRTLACGQKDVYLIHYPDGTYTYWFTNIPPASRYIFMWPWVADVGLSQSIEDIRSHPLVIIIRSPDFVLWNTYNTKEYLRPFDQVLEKEYIRVSPGAFVSPELAKRCNLSPMLP